MITISHHVTCKFNPIKGIPNKDIYDSINVIILEMEGLGRVATKKSGAGSFAKYLPASLPRSF